jgi:uncharacterized protein
MIVRIIEKRLKECAKSVLLLGPRQVGKSTLCQKLGPDLTVNLSDQEQFTAHLRDPGLIKRIVRNPQYKLIVIDEIQRLPELMNTVQYLIDNYPEKRFILTGSSARKLKRGNANLLPGRIVVMSLSPLLYNEVAKITNDANNAKSFKPNSGFNLQTALTKGMLPEIYLKDYGEEVLRSYSNTYLREEIQAEAATKDLAAYARFLDLAALKSGEQINFAKLASDSEINKETLRRYFTILEETLIVRKIPAFTLNNKKRRVQQKDRFLFFDLGVRNALLGITRNSFTDTDLGHLFEQWLILQLIYHIEAKDLPWQVKSFRTDRGEEVDIVLESSQCLIAIEVKYGTNITEKMCKNLDIFRDLYSNKNIKSYLVYRGEERQYFDSGTIAINYQDFLGNLDELIDI